MSSQQCFTVAARELRRHPNHVNVLLLASILLLVSVMTATVAGLATLAHSSDLGLAASANTIQCSGPMPETPQAPACDTRAGRTPQILSTPTLSESHSQTNRSTDPLRPPPVRDCRGTPAGSTRRGRKKVRRTRADIERERQTLLDRTTAEVDAIVAEHHTTFPRHRATAIAAVYARYSCKFQDSIGDQIRTLFDSAAGHNLFIPRELIFFDVAVRGCKDRRPGLTMLRQAIEEKAFDVLLVFSTNRLFRRAYKAMQFVEEELVERGIRAIFVKSNLDTTEGENWRTSLQLFATMDEAVSRMYPDHIRAAHIGLFRRGMVIGSLPLGYKGEDVLGELTKTKRPRCRIVVDPETAPWVQRIFRWFVDDCLPLDEIARRLNDAPESPAPPKSTTGWWTHELVRKHLIMTAYRGFWTYGLRECRWSARKDYTERVPRERPLASRQAEDLRIVSDELWYAAQERLMKKSGRSGRKPKDRKRTTSPQLLRQLFVCPEHSRRLVAGGVGGSIAFCPVCRATNAAERPLFSHLNRAMAQRLTCKKMAELVRLDDALVEEIIAACQREVESVQRPDPEAQKPLQARLAKLDSTIAFNRRNPGDTDEEQQRTEKLLKQLQGERAGILADLSALKAAKIRAIATPTPDQAREMLGELHLLLEAAASCSTNDEMSQARRIVELLTGGRIHLMQMGKREAKQGWLQGRFTCRLLSTLVEHVMGVRPLGLDDGIEVIIDFREPSKIDALSEQAKAMDDAGMMYVEIADRLGCSRNHVSTLLKYWYRSRGMEVPDGRARRALLAQKSQTPPLHQRIADQVMELYQQNMLLQNIAKTLNVHRDEITSAVKWWHEIRDLQVPDGRSRRKTLEVKTSKPRKASSDKAA